jgi:hypothetical protein
MNGPSKPQTVKISLELAGSSPVLKKLICDFPPNEMGCTADGLNRPRLTMLPQAVALVLVRFKMAQATERFTIRAKNASEMRMLKVIKTTKASSNEQMGQLRPLAKGAFMQLFINPPGVDGARTIELDVSKLQPSDVSIYRDGRSVELAALEALAESIATTWGWKTSDYEFEAVGDGTTQPVKEPSEASKTITPMEEAYQLADVQKISPLALYKEALFEAYAAYVEVGHPITGGTANVAGPALIGDIFVEPFCSEQRVSPAQMEAAIENGGAEPGEDLLAMIQAVFTGSGHRRLIILGDPGMGKSMLIRWLMVSPLLTGTKRKKARIKPMNLPTCLKSAIPLPFIVRDLVPYLPEDPEDWDWDALTHAFREFRATSTTMKPLLCAFDGADAAFESLLEDKNALFLIDGLDEIGTLRKRVKMSAAIMEGFERLPDARFIITSRVVGYDDARVHDRMVEAVRLVHPKKGNVVTNRDDAQKYGSEWTRSKLGPGETSLRETVANLVYLTPFTDQQQDNYGQRWFVVRFGEALGKNMATALMGDVRKKKSIRIISRVPNLLCLMAMLRSQNVPLPDGRAKLYDAISKEYLHTIQEVRGINPIDHGHSLPCSRKQAEAWLAIIAMHLQVRLGGKEDEVKLSSNRRQRREEESEKVLATQADLFDWLRPVLISEMPDRSTDELLQHFLQFITQRTAFLLQRGEGQYGFAHLSFLEYYAACWLAIEFHRLVHDQKAKTWVRDGLEQTKELFEQRAGEELWHEPLHFLAEILFDKNEYDGQTILKWMFPWFQEEDMQVLPDAERPSTEAGRLLATLSLDTEIVMPLEQRQRCWTYIWKQWLASQPMKVRDLHPWHVAPYLLEASTFQGYVIGCLAPLLRNHLGLLRLSNCPALRSLAFLSEATMIKGLSLSYCSSITSESLDVFRHLGQLKHLRLHECASVNDLCAIKHLKSLTHLTITDCRSVSDVSALVGLTKLRKLILSGCTRIVNLHPLASLSALSTLHLKGCTGLKDLSFVKKLQTLKVLFIEGCTGMIDLERKVKELQKAMPNLTIHR